MNNHNTDKQSCKRKACLKRLKHLRKIKRKSQRKKNINLFTILTVLFLSFSLILNTFPVSADDNEKDTMVETTENAPTEGEEENPAPADDSEKDTMIDTTENTSAKGEDENPAPADDGEKENEGESDVADEEITEVKDANEEPNGVTAQPNSTRTIKSENVTPIVNTEALPVTINLFDYGTNINNHYKSGEGLRFSDANYKYNIDQYNLDEVMADNRPELKPVLVNGYPVVNTYTVNDKTTGGFSLKYLFNKDLKPMTYKATVDTDSITNYEVRRYEIKKPYSGLFVKDRTGGNFNGYYVYDCGQYSASLNDGGNQFELYNYVQRPYEGAYVQGFNNFSYENFLPFNKAHTGYISKNEQIEGIGSYSPGKNFYRLPSRSNVTGESGTTDEGSIGKAADMWFGFTAEFDFNVRKDGKVLNPATGNYEDMIFDFRGDDDVWVFIDDVLVMDLGGTHGAENGNINFATGKITELKTDNETPLYDTEHTLASRFAAAGTSYTNNYIANGRLKSGIKHTFKFFYMERGGAISSMRMKFNLDPIPNSINVGKEVKNAEITKNGVIDTSINNPSLDIDDEFSYILYIHDPNNKQYVPYANQSYDLYDNGVSVGTGKTDASGVFKLKSNQTASFQNISSDTDYYVKELDDFNHARYTHVSVDGGTPKAVNSDTALGYSTVESKVINKNSAKFINFILLRDLTIKKIVEGDNDSSLTFPIRVLLNGKACNKALYDANGNVITDRTISDSGDTIIKNGDTLVIKDIPINTPYSVEELKDGWKYYCYDTSCTVDGITNEGYKTPDDCKIVNDSSKNTVQFTNIVKHFKIGVTKTDMSGNALKMEEGNRAEFTLYSSADITEANKIGTVTVDGNGACTFENLDIRSITDDTYYLVETKAPEGYELLGVVIPIKFELNTDTGEITPKLVGENSMVTITTDENDNKIALLSVKNVKSYVLPQTGGSGTLIFTVVGGILVLAAVLLVIIKFRNFGSKPENK